MCIEICMCICAYFELTRQRVQHVVMRAHPVLAARHLAKKREREQVILRNFDIRAILL